MIEDIDKEINMEISKSNPAKKVDDNENSNLEKHGEAGLSLGEEDIWEKEQATIKDGLVGGFVVGWSEPKSINKEGKVGRRKITKYDKGAEVAIEGPISISEQKKRMLDQKNI